MKSFPFFRALFSSSLIILFLGCSQNPSYTLSVTAEPSTSAYAATAFATQPVFTISPYSGEVANEGENITLSPYLDAACTVGADSSFTSTANQNTVSIVSGGTATFTSVAYGPPAHLEETIYLGAVGTSTGAMACTSGISVVQHFNAGLGCSASGLTGAAGGTVAGEIDNAKTSLVDVQGRIVIAGNSLSANAPAGYELALWRYFPDGTIDTSFGVNGTGYVSSGSATGAAGATGASENDIATSIQLDSEGRILVAGTSVNAAGGTELAIWRYTASGTLDTTFGTSGIVLSGTTGAAGASAAAELESVTALKLDSQGRMIIVGSSKNAGGGTELAIWRYTPAGALDTTFASVGYLHFGVAGAAGGVAGAELDLATGFQFDASGNIVVGGSSVNVAGGSEVAVWRYTSAGALDTTFNTTGFALSGTTGASGVSGATELDKANAIQIDSHSNLVLAGSSKNAGNGTELAFWRFTSAGILDVTLNTHGYVVSGTTGAAGATAAAEKDVGTSLQIDSNGNYDIGGTSATAVGGTVASVWRYLPAGTADTTFGSANGNALIGLGSATGVAGATGASQDDVVTNLAIDKKARILISGSSKNAASGQEIFAARYLATGILDY
jgi:uncharacterized delta-60 repeat protein